MISTIMSLYDLSDKRFTRTAPREVDTQAAQSNTVHVPPPIYCCVALT